MSESPVLLPLRGFNELETPRPVEQVSPLGTRNSLRAGLLGRRTHDRLWAKLHVSIVKVAKVARALSAVISELKSVPIGDTNILVLAAADKKITSAPTRTQKSPL
jgi:hypothetical protein